MVSLLKEIAQCFCCVGRLSPEGFVGLWLPALQGLSRWLRLWAGIFPGRVLSCGGGASACVRHRAGSVDGEHGHLFS